MHLLSAEQIGNQSPEYLERVSPEHCHTAVYKNHFARYSFSEKIIAQKSVIDVGCGTGYGSFHLSRSAADVTGVDKSEEAVDYAKITFNNTNLDYHVMDCTSLTFPDNTFDAATAFEILEHVPDHEKMIAEIWRVLKPGGTAVISTPNKDIFSPEGTPPNPYHCREFRLAEFNELLMKYFQQVKIYGQKDSSRVQEVFHGSRLKRIFRKLDFLRVHDLIPRNVYCTLSRFFGFATEEDITLEDYSQFPETGVELSENFIAVCKKGNNL